MRILEQPDRGVPTMTIEYALMPSCAYLDETGQDEEPIALCTVRWERAASDAWLEYQLVAWHFPASGSPIAMPVEDVDGPDEGIFVGSFLLLPRCDLTLELLDGHGQARPLVQLGLRPAASSREGEEEGLISWGVVVVWSEGVVVALQKARFLYPLSSVRSLSLSMAQCISFLRMGGLLREPVRITSDATATKAIGSVSGTQGIEVALYQENLRARQLSCSTYPDLQAALVQAGVDLAACWVLLARICPECRMPILSENGRVATLWGWRHPGCAQVGTRLAVGTEPGVEGAGNGWTTVPSCQPALPGME